MCEIYKESCVENPREDRTSITKFVSLILCTHVKDMNNENGEL